MLTEADRDGTLVVRGSTLAGLLRDAAWHLLDLSPLAMHSKEEVLERIFGSSAQTKRWFYIFSLPDENETGREKGDTAGYVLIPERGGPKP